MLIPIFPRPITSSELSRMAGEHQLRLPLANRTEPERILPEVDQQLLRSTLELLALAPVHLQMLLQQGEAAQPLMDVFVSAEHIIAAVYGTNGIAFHEALAPADVKRVLMQPFVLLPVPAEQNDRQLPLTAAPRDVLAALKNGNAPEGLSDSEAAEICRCACENRIIRCMLERGGENTMAFAIAGKDRVFSLLEEEQSLLVIGSPLRLLQSLNGQLLTAFRELLKAVK